MFTPENFQRLTPPKLLPETKYIVIVYRDGIPYIEFTDLTRDEAELIKSKSPLEAYIGTQELYPGKE